MLYSVCPIEQSNPCLVFIVTLFLQVYSLFKNVLIVDLYDTSTEEDVHINQKLVEEGFAQFEEESRASKVNKNNNNSSSNYREQ